MGNNLTISDGLYIKESSVVKDTDKAKSKTTFKMVLMLSAGGILVGFANGFFGGGGGLIAVPILAGILKLEAKKSHATAILVILPLSIASAVVYILRGNFELSSSISPMLGIIAGGLAGAYLLSKLSNNVIKIIFAVIMIAGGVYMFFR